MDRKHQPARIVSNKIRITFHKEEEELLLINFNLFSFLLNNRYIPVSKKDYLQFEKKLVQNNITYHDLKDIVKVECIHRKNYISRNYKLGRDYIKKYIDQLSP